MLSFKIPRILQSSIATLAAQEVAGNDDLLMEIFLRLPIQSLLKFKSVSKRWLSLISNPRFSHNRITFCPNTPSGIFLRRSFAETPMYDFVNLTKNPSRPPFESLGFVHQRNGITILKSCNGLLLCSSEDLNYSRRDFYIYNPTNKQFTTLPKLNTTQGEDPRYIFGVNLAYDPSKSAVYKVICVRNSDSLTNNYQIEIYSSQTGPWRSCQGIFAAPFTIRFDCGVYWNEAIHWISTAENSLYFDLQEEKIHDLPMPLIPEDYEMRYVEYFGECGGHLNLIEIYEPETLEFDVYEMKDDRSAWFVKYHVDLRCVFAAIPEIIPIEDDFSILSVIQSEVDEESYLVLLIHGKVVRVSVKSMRFEELVDIEEDTSVSSAVVPVGFGGIDAYLYLESLACV